MLWLQSNSLWFYYDTVWSCEALAGLCSRELTFMLQASSISFLAFSSERYRLGTGTRKNLRAPSKSAWIKSSFDVCQWQMGWGWEVGSRDTQTVQRTNCQKTKLVLFEESHVGFPQFSLIFINSFYCGGSVVAVCVYMCVLTFNRARATLKITLMPCKTRHHITDWLRKLIFRFNLTLNVFLLLNCVVMQ